MPGKGSDTAPLPLRAVLAIVTVSAFVAALALASLALAVLSVLIAG